ncbi:hypothetical protein GINT2_001373 [Glugoides intestinalis]
MVVANIVCKLLQVVIKAVKYVFLAKNADKRANLIAIENVGNQFIDQIKEVVSENADKIAVKELQQSASGNPAELISNVINATVKKGGDMGLSESFIGKSPADIIAIDKQVEYWQSFQLTVAFFFVICYIVIK